MARWNGATGVALAAAVVMVAASVVFFGPGFFTGREMFFTNEAVIGTATVGSDIWHFNYPIKHFYAEELRQFRLPFWCPHSGAGIPLLAEGQVGALYPPNLLLFGLLPLPIAFNVSIVLHVVLAGVFAALFAYQLGAGGPGGVLAGVLFGFCGFMVVHLKHLNMLQAAVWAPFLLFHIDRALRGRARASITWIACIVAAMILTGHPQIAYYNLLIGALYCVYRAISLCRGGASVRSLTPRQAGSRVAGVCGAVCVGFLLAAPQILPTAQLTSLGIRSQGVGLEDPNRIRFTYSHLITFLNPYHFGDPGSFTVPAAGGAPSTWPGFYDVNKTGNFFWEITGYVGLPGLLLAAFALCLAVVTRSRAVVPAVILLVPSLLLALGREGGLAWLFYHVVPGFSRFRFYSRFLLYVDLALALLAGLGVGLWLCKPRPARRVLALSLVTLAILACFADLYRVLGHYNPRVATAAWAAPPPSVRRIRAEETGDRAPYRMASADVKAMVFANSYYRAGGWRDHLDAYEPAWTMVHPDLNVLHDVPAVGKYYSSLISGWLNADLPWSLYNVRYIVTPYGTPPESMQVDFPGATLLATYPGDRIFATRDSFDIRLYKNPAACPRAFLVPRAVVRPGDVTRAIQSRRFDPRAEVIIDQAPKNGFLGGAGDSIGTAVRFDEYGAQRIRLQVTAPAACWLFLSDAYYPEWKCSVDGSRVPVYRANEAGRAVQVPQGTHEIVFVYEPRTFEAGLGVGALGLVLLGVWTAAGRRRRPPAA